MLITPDLQSPGMSLHLGLAGFWDPVVTGKKNVSENGCLSVCRYVVLGSGGGNKKSVPHCSQGLSSLPPKEFTTGFYASRAAVHEELAMLNDVLVRGCSWILGSSS